MRRCLTSCVMLLFLQHPILAQDAARRQDDRAVAKAAHEMFQATKKGDWKETARQMHPEALASFKDMLQPVFKSISEFPQKHQDAFAVEMGIKDLPALRKMSPEDLFHTFISGVVEKHPEVKQVLAAADMEYLGAVYEKGDLAHAVVRIKAKIGEAEIIRLDVTTFKRSGAEWKGSLSGEMKGLAEQLRKSIRVK